MSFDFATRIDRRQHPAQKWHRYDEDVLPLWVADMDFASPPAVVEAVQARAAHPVYGYGHTPATLREALCSWSASHYEWNIEPAWQVWLPGVVPALHLASLALTAPGEGVLSVTPIYPPFLKVAERTGRLKQTVPLGEPESAGAPWRLDLEALEAALTPETRLLLWCHPHNPTGRVWSREELVGLADIAERHDLLIVSDELHCDLVLDSGRRHQPLASLDPRLAKRTITLWAASKTFNVAGLTCACAVIADAGLRRRFREAGLGLLPDVNVLGLAAAEAAYTQGEPWRQALLATLRDNLTLLETFVARWPGVHFSPPQSTYLAWLDLRRTGLGDSPQQALLKEARVALSDGADFGWPGFVRLNFGTPRGVLHEALERLDPYLSRS
ncbi:PatB family C-S lyase [Halomonas shantousis]